jgi:SMC interacting uncharacterized protein involved in chromosome segregation
MQARLPAANSQKAELIEDVGLKRAALTELQAWVTQLGGRMADAKKDLALKGALFMPQPETCSHRALLCCNIVTFSYAFAEQELHRAEAAHEQLERRLEAQEIQPADVERMARQKASLREETAKAQAETRASADRALKLSQDIKAALERLRSVTSEYNAAANKLQIAPAGAKYSQDQNFALRVHDTFLNSLASSSNSTAVADGATAASAATSAGLLGNDVKGVVKFGLREMKAKLARTSSEASRSIVQIEDELAGLAESRADATKKIEAVRVM